MTGKRADKRVNINRIIYGILCLILGFLFVFYLDGFTFMLLLFLILIGIASFILFRYQMENIDINVSFEERQIRQGSDVKVVFTLDNKGNLPLTNIYGVICIRNAFEEEEKEYIVNFSAPRENEGVVSFTLSSSNCLAVYVKCKSFFAYDYLCMHKKSYELENKEDVCYILPKSIAINIDKMPGKEDEEEEKENNIIGEDVSEIADIRDFRPGDKMSRIHWKLTTKCDELMVKQFALEYGSRLVLALDMWEEEKSETLDSIIVTAYNFSKLLMDSGKQFSIKWYDGYTGRYKEADVDNTNTFSKTESSIFLDNVFKDILKSGLSSGKGQVYSNEREANNQHFLYVTTKDNMDSFLGEMIGITEDKVVLLWV